MSDEKVEVYTEKGEATGIAKLKKHVHRDGDWHRTVHVWIVNSNGELLIQRRASCKESYPLLWDVSSAGHIPFGEDSRTSALREVEEELGIKLVDQEMQFLFTYPEQSITNDGTFINNEFIDMYLVEKDIRLDELVLQKEEVCDAQFIHYSLLQQLYENLDKRFVVGHSGNAKKVESNVHYNDIFKEVEKRYGHTKPRNTDLSFLTK